MTPARWKEVSKLYEAARARPAHERDAFLAEACTHDATLRHEVQSLLDQPSSLPQLQLASSVVKQAMRDWHDAALTGRRFGDYLVGERIDSGGMGEVFRARDTRLGRDVAIKILPPACSPTIPSASRASSARRGCWRRSITRTSARSTASRDATACRRSCWSWSRARRCADAPRQRGPVSDRRGARRRATDCRRARSRARQGHRPPRSQAGQHQDHAGRLGEGARLRAGQGCRRRCDRCVPERPRMASPAPAS